MDADYPVNCKCSYMVLVVDVKTAYRSRFDVRTRKAAAAQINKCEHIHIHILYPYIPTPNMLPHPTSIALAPTNKHASKQARK